MIPLVGAVPAPAQNGATSNNTKTTENNQVGIIARYVILIIS